MKSKSVAISLGLCIILFVNTLEINSDSMNPPCDTSKPCPTGLTCVDYGIKINGNTGTSVCDCITPDANCECKAGNSTYKRWIKKDKCFLDNGELCNKKSMNDANAPSEEKCVPDHKCMEIKDSPDYGFCRRSDASNLQTTFAVMIASASLASFWLA